MIKDENKPAPSEAERVDYERERSRAEQRISELMLAGRRAETVITVLSDKITELEIKLKYSKN